MEFFRQLGDALNSRWRAQGGREELFPTLAAEVLREFNPPAHVDSKKIIEWTLKADTLPYQSPDDEAAPVTLYWNERFTVYALFWVDGTTVIHDHSAWGAFQVLEGSSIHTTYTFNETERLTAYTALGDLKVLTLETLKVGDVHPVAIGRNFIHSLFHLDRPSVTIAIFTRSPPHWASLYAYLKPGFAWISRFREQRLTRQLTALELVHTTRPDDYEATLLQFLAGADLMYTYQALTQAVGNLGEAPFNRVLDAALTRYPRVASAWREGFRELRRINNIKGRRLIVHDREHRFFLAAVMNAPKREDVLRLVAERVPGRDPIDTILQWVRELAEIPVEGPAGPTAIGVPLDEAGLLVLEALLRGRDVMATLKQTFKIDEVESQRADVEELIAAFRESLFFGPLLPT